MRGYGLGITLPVAENPLGRFTVHSLTYRLWNLSTDEDHLASAIKVLRNVVVALCPRNPGPPAELGLVDLRPPSDKN